MSDPSVEPAWAIHLPSDVRPADVNLQPAANLTAHWRQHWASDPQRVVLADDQGRSFNGDELEHATTSAAGRLAGHGAQRGDRVLISCGSSLELAVAHIAALRLGLVVVPANTAYRAEELAHVVSDAGPTLAIVDDPERAGWVAEANPAIIVLTPDVPGQLVRVEDLDTAAAGDPALIGYTSGTTGRPKGAVLSHANLLATAEAVRVAWRWNPDDRLWLCLPLFHMHGLGVGLHGTLGAGASAHITSRFELGPLLGAAKAGAMSLFFGVPTMYHRLAGDPEVAALAKLRLLVSGSAPLPAELHRQIEAASGSRVLERYGMTETAMLVSNPYDGQRRAGTVGLPLPGVELRLHPDSGEVLVRGPNVFAGYLGSPEANAEVFSGDGYFHTGDVGRFDDAGYLELVARLKELIISGGYNVYPREVEDALRLHPAVIDAAVVGLPDPAWGEIVTAYCETDGTVDPQQLVAFVGQHLAGFKRPKQVTIVAALPRNALGKVVKSALGDAVPS